MLYNKNKEKVYLDRKMSSKFLHNEFDTDWLSRPADNQKIGIWSKGKKKKLVERPESVLRIIYIEVKSRHVGKDKNLREGKY